MRLADSREVAGRPTHFSRSERRALEKALTETVQPALQLGGTTASRLHAVAQQLLGKPPPAASAAATAAASRSSLEQQRMVAELSDAFQKALVDASLQRRLERDGSRSDDVPFLLCLVAQSLLAQGEDAAADAAFASSSPLFPTATATGAAGASSATCAASTGGLFSSVTACGPRECIEVFGCASASSLTAAPAPALAVTIPSDGPSTTPPSSASTPPSATSPVSSGEASFAGAAGFGGQSVRPASLHLHDPTQPTQRARTMRASRASTESAVSTGSSIPGVGDEVLGRLLKDVLRHKAKDTGVSISPDGWMAIDDALSCT